MPDEYPLIRAARYLGVAPWELAERSVFWQEWALLFEAAEHRAQAIAADIQQQRDKMAAGGGKTGGEIDDEAWRADLLAQIEAQGGAVKRDGEQAD